MVICSVNISLEFHDFGRAPISTGPSAGLTLSQTDAKALIFTVCFDHKDCTVHLKSEDKNNISAKPNPPALFGSVDKHMS